MTSAAKAGLSIWLDDLSRERITSGNLEHLITAGISGVTTNPAIFKNALAGPEYDEQLAGLHGVTADEAVDALTTVDVRHACDIFAETYAATGGVDGRVSLEVDPRLARDTEATVEAAHRLWERVDRPNAMIKIPATAEGLPAITSVIASGISVNATLIFSVDRYRAVAEHYIDGLEQALEAGIDLSTIGSVASVFVSRIDTKVDPILVDVDECDELCGQVALGNARLVYEAYQEIFSSPRFEALTEYGARPQRVLYASTGVKNPDYSPTMYVDGLVESGVVNTMPEATFSALDGVELTPSIVTNIDDARATLNTLARHDIDLSEITAVLEDEGLAQFETAWTELLSAIDARLPQD